MSHSALLSGVKRTCPFASHMSAFDPKRTWANPFQAHDEDNTNHFPRCKRSCGARIYFEFGASGGNITGLTSFEFEIGGKWLQLLKEIVPDLSRVSVIYNPEAGHYAINLMQSMTAIRPSTGADLIATPIRNTGEIELAVANFATGSRAGLIVIPYGFMIANHSLIVSVAARFRLPAIYPYGYFAVAGGLLSYGHPTVDVFRQGPVYVDKILHGAKPADLAVQSPTRYELVINQKTAKTLGLTIPADLLARADEVIE